MIRYAVPSFRGLLCALCALLVLRTAVAAPVSEFADFSLTNDTGNVILPGRLFIPPEATSDPTTPRPLILFLHGAGQRGTDNMSQVAGMDGLFTESKQRGAFIYAPQINVSQDWNNAVNTIGQMLDRAASDYNVDVDRIYVTGVSLGGGGTWTMLSYMPNRFAAGMPVSGTGGVLQVFSVLEQSIWAFHARNDDVVNVDSSRGNVGQLLLFAGEPLPRFPAKSDTRTTLDFNSTNIDLRYTEFPTGGHNIANSLYKTEAVYDWMFAHTLAVPEPSSGAMLVIGVALLAAYRRRRIAQDRGDCA